jgi:hypothetical protein
MQGRAVSQLMAASMQPRLPAIEAPPPQQRLPPAHEPSTSRPAAAPRQHRGSYSDAHQHKASGAASRKGSMAASAAAAAAATGQLGGSFRSEEASRRGSTLPTLPAVAMGMADVKERARSIVANAISSTGALMASSGYAPSAALGGGYASRQPAGALSGTWPPEMTSRRTVSTTGGGRYAHVHSKIHQAAAKYVEQAGQEARQRQILRQESSKDRISEAGRLNGILRGAYGSKKWQSVH